jgi:hypothetical protein
MHAECMAAVIAQAAAMFVGVVAITLPRLWDEVGLLGLSISHFSAFSSVRYCFCYSQWQETGWTVSTTRRWYYYLWLHIRQQISGAWISTWDMRLCHRMDHLSQRTRLATKRCYHTKL